VCVVGLGYVGLPLAVGFAKHLPTIGFDVNETRVKELQEGYDRNGETPEADLRNPNLTLTTDPTQMRDADVIIITVPTPIDKAKRPDLRYLISASQTVGQHMKRGAIVVYESTVYPGCTEEDCAPVLEQASGMKAGVDFKLGYSPERINPGDSEHTLETIVKVVAGQDEETTEILAQLYGLGGQSGHPQSAQHPHRRSREGHRKHPARPEHRADERTGDAVPCAGAEHARCAGGGAHQMELPAV
jgi:UDP-N-acetyl-D-galactosamine dehydrogenase